MIKTYILAASALVMSFGASAAMSPQLESTLISVCKAGASNSVVQFNRTMKDYRINKSRVFPRLVCNGESFYNFTVNAGADKTAKRIAPYTRGQGRVTIKDIAMTESDTELYVVNYE
ncbi:DUF3718 domain-containing protein [Shewanella schlegeliana]|uniref:DUF3718 domain-containing protein n=1 Tax=Shewanella schlegeliana TaxID=190308 RepID=A0ABS1SY20_9GAMM|nr:DUF3718 domain-containing protein [Shewanella schlegeliana]MBL4913438.1 DUF3718 domain-containing protein [Shewanella schlegeliana]MCL1108328.1 DUF3718 domain-containing protein [Shewanella schlegeliana]GIU34415.1 hypothetical protein TUM4433_30470 [Shewanella schlegeliana]